MLGTIILVLSVLSIILGFIATRLQKRRMRNALGREVNDGDLSSFGSWMAVNEAEEKQHQQE